MTESNIKELNLSTNDFSNGIKELEKQSFNRVKQLNNTSSNNKPKLEIEMKEEQSNYEVLDSSEQTNYTDRDSNKSNKNSNNKINKLNENNTDNNNIISGINESDIIKESAVVNPSSEMFGNIFYKKPFRLGNTYAFCWFRGEPLFVIGPHWPFFLCLNSIIMSISISYFYFLWNNIYVTARNIGFSIFIFQSVCYWYTAIINPGIPIKHHLQYSNIYNNSPENSINDDTDPEVNNNINNVRKVKKSKKVENKRICRSCNLLIDLDLDMIHCEDCDVCVEGHDHHCPWTSKCIGKNNLYSFYGFVFGTLALFFYLIFGLVFIKPSGK
jgi:hypothetical protein